jgi:hypothetical protein
MSRRIVPGSQEGRLIGSAVRAIRVREEDQLSNQNRLRDCRAGMIVES